MATTHTTTGITIEDLQRSWTISLRAGNKSPRTIENYTETLGQFTRFLRANGLPTGVAAITREHVETFLAKVLGTNKPSTAQTRYTGLRVFFRWAMDDGEISETPMRNMRPIPIPEDPVPILTNDQQNRLLKTCSGTTFADRRDRAILHVLIDTGLRRGEVAGIRVHDIDWEQQIIRVLGKGGRERHLPFGRVVTQTLDRYARIRGTHARAHDDGFWLGQAGALTGQGIRQMIERRAAQAGIEGVHAHQFRHTFAHEWLSGGGSETDLMRLV